ncbi:MULTISPECIES: hypothetical protein [Citrobacter]|nr:hypothetical protein [Citrobacter sp. Cu096]MDM2742975.1 hypothetical protein [Citrobacter sp. Cu096]
MWSQSGAVPLRKRQFRAGSHARQVVRGITFRHHSYCAGLTTWLKV